MIVKVIGRDAAGACVERDAAEINLWENTANLRKLAREMARSYLEKWPPFVARVEIRKDTDHGLIASVKRKA